MCGDSPPGTQQLNKTMERLKTVYKGMNLYFAGFPGFQNIFVRDGIESGLVSNNLLLLDNFIVYSALHQGTRYDPKTGQEPGKHPHERNPQTHQGIELEAKPGLTTEYNACDTTALWLIGLEHLVKQTKDWSIVEKLQENIEASVAYIKTHINEQGQFFEDPRLSGATEFALNVTYWKDSVIPERKNGKPVYPIVYTLAHIQNMAGLRAAAILLNSREPETLITKMKKALDSLWDGESGTFYIAIDDQGPVKGISSDSLHALFYLEPGDLKPEQIEQIVVSSRQLVTKAGYRALAPCLARVKDGYHARTIWPYEQAKINIGAKKHKIWSQTLGLNTTADLLKVVEDVSARVMNWLREEEHEILVIGRGRKITNGGNNPQLWTIAAKDYFARNTPLVVQ